MTINSQTYSLSTLLLLGSFEPAPVQREFQWQAVHTRQLLDDIIGAFQRVGADPDQHPPQWAATASAAPHGSEPPAEGAEANEPHLPIDSDKIAKTRARVAPRRPPDRYYLGAIILLPAPQKKGAFHVYDGLQRLTTLNLMLARLRESWQRPSKSDKQRLSGLLLWQEAGTEDRQPRLRMPTPGATLAYEINRASARRTKGLTESDWRMRDAADYFSKAFESWSDRRRTAFLRYLADRVAFTVTRVDNASLAYQMFVAANARGLDLEVGDILKGQLVEQANRSGAPVAQINAIAAGWRAAQRQLRKGFSDLVPAIEMMKFRPSNRHTPGELLVTQFRHADAAQIDHWLHVEFAELVDLFQLARQHLQQPVVTGIDIRFRQLSFLGWKEWQPFYLALALGCPDRSSAAYYERIAALQRVCYTIELLGWSERARRRRFLAALQQLEQGHDPFASDIGEGQSGALHIPPKLKKNARLALRSPLIGDEQRGAIVRWLETLHWPDKLPRNLTDDSSVEHVLPRSPTDGWQNGFSEDELERLTNRLGNLCLIPKRVNDSIGNSDWADKERVYRSLKKPSVGVALVLKAAELVTAPGQPSCWNAAAIAHLTEHLASRAEEALGLEDQSEISAG